MKLSTRYDGEADAAYIYLDDSADVVRTVELDEDVMIDLDSDDKIVGIELLKAGNRIKLPGISQKAV